MKHYFKSLLQRGILSITSSLCKKKIQNIDRNLEKRLYWPNTRPLDLHMLAAVKPCKVLDLEPQVPQ